MNNAVDEQPSEARVARIALPCLGKLLGVPNDRLVVVRVVPLGTRAYVVDGEQHVAELVVLFACDVARARA